MGSGTDNNIQSSYDLEFSIRLFPYTVNRSGGNIYRKSVVFGKFDGLYKISGKKQEKLVYSCCCIFMTKRTILFCAYY